MVKYGDAFGFLGFYIAKPEFRGKGYGIQVWNAGMSRLKGRNVGLDGVVEQQDNYKKSGFKLAYRNVRYQGRVEDMNGPTQELVDLSSVPFERVEAYDRPFFPEKRTSFLKSWIQQPEGKALGVIQRDELAGYGVARKCRSGYKIGPLFVDSPEIAESLLHGLCHGLEPEESVFLDVPEVNAAAVNLAGRHQMEIVFETARMYTGPAPELPLDRLFGVTTFELG